MKTDVLRQPNKLIKLFDFEVKKKVMNGNFGEANLNPTKEKI